MMQASLKADTSFETLAKRISHYLDTNQPDALKVIIDSEDKLSDQKLLDQALQNVISTKRWTRPSTTQCGTTGFPALVLFGKWVNEYTHGWSPDYTLDRKFLSFFTRNE